MMTHPRREFLSTVSSCLLLASPLVSQSISSTLGKRYAMLMDVEKCFGCMACVVACAAENNVPLGVFRTWIEYLEKPDGTRVFIPKQCNHCEDPPCVTPCPTKATYVTPDGLVLVNDELCIGCGACIMACPYGARYRNPIKGVADKCTFCDHRLAEGLLPACVEACPTGARIFGPLTEENELSNTVEGRPTQVLKPFTGAKPMIFYLGLPDEVNR
ncbi:MAG: 4Fe-4S dicluster domain-containing protein [Candidatus Caldarchaeum sp.]|nr:4Fe-4S dicluster domain-containing protein [Candidatus Caldarchaeum sp.]MCX8201039.1 4Fe-4S dicluster domain-containing protein [Candidatus Caldarchaeum sp.]MDW8435959.1 4Fe-4S dicluster domain-containing protein [Candidatus Caldarchaeum sp.]